MIRLPSDQIPGYHIAGVLGRGGMATVYLAVQESLHRHVALKVLHPMLARDSDLAKRFLNESQIVGQLNHTNIVTIFDFGEYNGYYFLAMERLAGGSLRDRIQRGQSLMQASAQIKDLAAALGYAHQCGFVHRDIKPQNILFRDDGSPVLTDFGIAKALGTNRQLTQTGFTYGSVGYMSPEQARGQPLDHRADLYSFGVLVWEMLTGSPPYRAADTFALAQQHLSAPIPALPPNLRAFQPTLDKLLAKHPHDRYAVIEQFLLDWDSIINDRSPTLSITADDSTEVIRTPSTDPTPLSDRSTASDTALRLQLAILAAVFILVNAGALVFASSLNPFTAAAIARNDVGVTVEARARLNAASTSSATLPVVPASEDQSDPIQPLLAQAQALYAASELDASLAEIRRGLRSVPESPALLALHNRVQRRIEVTESTVPRSAMIEALLQRADQQLAAGRYAEPNGDNAFETYRQVLTLAPDHRAAITGLLTVGRMRHVQRALQTAETHWQAGDREATLVAVKRGLRHMPDFPALLDLQQRVQALIN